LTLFQRDRRRSHSYVLERNLEETPKNPTYFCFENRRFLVWIPFKGAENNVSHCSTDSKSLLGFSQSEKMPYHHAEFVFKHASKRMLNSGVNRKGEDE